MTNTDDKKELQFFEPIIQSAQIMFNVAGTSPAKERFINAVKLRMKSIGAGSVSDYASYLRQDSGEWRKLWPLYFDKKGFFLFPEPQYEVAGELISQWAIMAPDRNLKILSLGCGAGYEVVSLAIMLEETGLRGKNWQVEIYGVDLNPEAVEHARIGVFSEEDMQWLSDSRRRKWFSPRSGGWSFKRDLAPTITLITADAYDPSQWSFGDLAGSFNLIFSRNLLHDAPDDAFKKLPLLLKKLLSEDGFIFTAPGEFIDDSAGELWLEETAGITYYRRGAPNKIKVNVHHRPRRKKDILQETDTKVMLPALNPRESSLLGEAKAALANGSLEHAWDLLDELAYSNMDRGRPSPEAWQALADVQKLLGRPAAAAAAVRASEAYE